MDEIFEAIEDHIVSRFLFHGIETACRDPSPQHADPLPKTIVHVIHTTADYEVYDDHVKSGLKRYDYEDPESIDRLNRDIDTTAGALIDFRR